MTDPEDLVRSTTRAIAGTVRDVPPLRLSPAPAPAPAPGELTPPARTARPLRSWLVPAAAAAAVLALAVSLVAVRALHAGPAAAPAGSVATAKVPAYYVEPESACKTCKTTRLVVGDTFTGATLATVDPPLGSTFEAVSAAADDRTFVADTVGYPSSAAGQRVTWYLLKITPGAPEPARLTRLRIPNTSSPSLVGAIALSPSGSELAVSYRNGPQSAPTGAELRIYSVATGKLLNSWSATSGYSVLAAFDFEPYTASNNLLSWVDGGRAVSFTTDHLIFTPPQRINYTVDVTVRAVNATARGGDLNRDSRVIWSTQYQENNYSCADGFNIPRLTADGATVLCAEGDANPGFDPSGNRVAFPLAWLSYPTSQPKAARTLYTSTAYSTGTNPVSHTSVQWDDPSGSTLIVAWSATSQTFSAVRFGVISHGAFTPLPTPPGITVGSPPDIAW